MIKSKIKIRNLLYEKYRENGRFQNYFVLFKTVITEHNKLDSSSISLY